MLFSGNSTDILNPFIFQGTDKQIGRIQALYIFCGYRLLSRRSFRLGEHMADNWNLILVKYQQHRGAHPYGYAQ